MDISTCQKDFAALSRKWNGMPLIYFDNAATTLKPQIVIDAMREYYERMPANVHRGLHKLSQEASFAFEKSHETVARFISAKPEQISFTLNTTTALNGLMYGLLTSGKLNGKKIVLTKSEHHANLVPWQFAAQHVGATLEFAELNADYSVNLDDLAQKTDRNTAVVSLAHVSNTVAAINDVRAAARIAHDSGAYCIVDAAQSVPHLKVDAPKLECDYMAFSGHKMCGPTGIGALYIAKNRLDETPPFLYGGSMIHSVSYEHSTYNSPPDKFEAGTPPIAQAIGFSAAVDYLTKLGMDNVRAHEQQLIRHALKRLSEIDGLTLYNPKDATKQAGILLFDLKGIGSHEVALALDEAANIAVRSGMHCAEPLVSKLNSDGLCRASFYIYNSTPEIDVFASRLEDIATAFR